MVGECWKVIHRITALGIINCICANITIINLDQFGPILTPTLAHIACKPALHSLSDNARSGTTLPRMHMSHIQL